MLKYETELAHIPSPLGGDAYVPLRLKQMPTTGMCGSGFGHADYIIYINIKI